MNVKQAGNNREYLVGEGAYFGPVVVPVACKVYMLPLDTPCILQ